MIATRHPSGRLQLSPVLAGIDGEGRAIVSTRETARKTRNLTRDPWTSLCGMNDRFFGDWVQVEGAAEIVHLPEAMEPLVDYYRRLAGEHPDWEDYRAAMVRDRRVLLRIALTRAGPDLRG